MTTTETAAVRVGIQAAVPVNGQLGEQKPGRLLALGLPVLVEHSSLRPDVAVDIVDAIARLRTITYEAVLVAGLAEPNALEFIAEALRVDAGVAVILLAPSADDAGVVRLIRAGAFDVWRDSWDELRSGALLARKLEISLGFLRSRQTEREREAAAEPWRRLLVGQSRAIQQVYEVIRLVGPRRSSVLITGETGTGKELVARALHLASDRRQMPLVAVNCSALPENLLEAELFGHVKGAYTGAFQSRAGRFEQANRGTIFLDEIAEMPLDLQAKLLRVLQEREFQRLGSSETTKVDVRVITACNVDLAARVREGRFREDLYYRINVVPLALPPLRARRGDVALLAGHFAEKVCRQEQIPLKQLSAESLERLERYDWPGNVRQLENAIEMAMALSGERALLYPSDFPMPAGTSTVRPSTSALPEFALPDQGLDFEATLGRIELSILGQALERANGNKTLAADLLRLKRTTLTAKLRSLEEQSRTWT